MENVNQQSKSQVRKKIEEYQKYISDYKNYLEFKELNAYAEIDKDYETAMTKVDSRNSLIL